MHRLGQFIQRALQVARLHYQLVDDSQQRGRIGTYQCIDDGGDVCVVNTAQHIRHIGILEAASAIGDRLVQQAETIAYAAVGGAGDAHDRRSVRRDRFGLQDFMQVRADLPG